MTKKIARCSSRDQQEYECRHPWPLDDCFVQSGDMGLVLRDKDKGGSYNTAFFEAFPRYPDTFIRGEGETIAEAEDQAWNKYQKHLNCPGHEFERRGYKNGAGFCKHCDLFSGHQFDPLEICCVCGDATYFTVDIDGKWYCQKDASKKPLDKYTETDKMFAEMKDNVK